jgi:uncharacterized protein (UPF0371 family)
MRVEELITDKELEIVFGDSNFGDTSKRDVIKYALLKKICGYSNGFTAESIIKKLELLTNRGGLTKKGRKYFWSAFSKQEK